MSEKVIKSESELYNQIVEMLSSGNFLQLNGKAISLTELNEYINAKQEEIERLNSIIKEVRECINHYAIENEDYSKIYNDEEKELLEILDGENNDK